MPAPTLTSISPNVGGTVGGSEVTLTGSNFTGATGVTIGGVACTSVVVVSDTSITCVTPAGSAGDASVVVTNGSGSNSSNSLWIYLPTVPMDVYVYLKGGRGDGFIPGYTGVFSDTTVVEKSPGYRNNYQSAVSLNPGQGMTVPGRVTAVTRTDHHWLSLTPTTPSSTTLSITATNDDLSSNTPPRQWDRSVTWRRYIGEGGMEFPFRLDLILGIGTKKRGV